MLQSAVYYALLVCMVARATTNAIRCPDNHQCGEGHTCCQMGSGHYGCCPFPDAICCSDKQHCCPNGHTCDLLHERCISETSYSVTPLGKPAVLSKKYDFDNSVQPKFNKLMMLLGRPLADQICPDDTHCKDTSTCCPAQQGYRCCPSSNAVCCSDKQTCCPHGYTCEVGGPIIMCRIAEDSSSGMLAFSESGLQEIMTSETSRQELERFVVCPGGKISCQAGETCCPDESGDEYNCCRFRNAVCCSDHAHCCPSGAQCDLVRERCVLPIKSLQWAKKLPAKSSRKAATLWTSVAVQSEVVCPDHKSKCADGNTCCSAVHGYACCPLPHAVCCEDRIHCCPSGTHCNTQTGSCNRGNLINDDVPWVSKVAAQPVSTDVKLGIVCPGGGAECEDQQTCCKLKSGQWGCCPAPNAVCCDDREHCCPNGYKCLAGGRCSRIGF